MILVNHDTEGSIRLKTEYQSLSKGIELYNENSENGSKLFLNYLLYLGNEFYDEDHNDDIYSEMFGDIDISSKQLSRLNKIAELFWDNIVINEMIARVCSRFLFDFSFKCRRFWHYQLNMRLLLEDNKKINEDDQIKLISTFADLSNEGIPLVQLLYEKDTSSEGNLFDKKTNVFEQSFNNKVDDSLLNSINTKLNGKFSLNEILISSAKYILSEKGFTRVLNEYNPNKICSNAFFVLFMLDRHNLSNYLYKDIFSLFSSNNFLKSFHVRYHTGSRTNYFNQSTIEENSYPFELIDVLEKMHPDQNEIKIFSSIFSSDDKSIKDKLKKTVMMLNTKSPLFLFEKGLILFLIYNNTINVRSLSAWTRFI